MEAHPQEISFDRAPVFGLALDLDVLDRRSYAESIARILDGIPLAEGITVAIEGAWGSGKTTTLRMIEAILLKSSSAARPVIVHFNPWLIGERDALLNQFFGCLIASISKSEQTDAAKNVAKELKAYAKVFDVIKLIPGADPWASVIKSVVDSVGDATAAIAEHKAVDLNVQKAKVEQSLRDFKRSIVVIIDDLDRLFPTEVFEMIRIVKAVGELPNVGYVLAWDANYIGRALENVGVPMGSGYLDKIVQVRMPLPRLSNSAKMKLVNKELEFLHSDAHFLDSIDDEVTFSDFYYRGLRDALEQPRDIIRVFNTVRQIEPRLRGEVVLADIVGLALLIVKAPAVYRLLLKNSRCFVGYLHSGIDDGKADNELKYGQAERDKAYAESENPKVIREVVRYMFPNIDCAERDVSLRPISRASKRLANPSRLHVALQQGVAPSDVSFFAASRFVISPQERANICAALQEENCVEFLESLGDVSEGLEEGLLVTSLGLEGVDALCVEIARLVDLIPFKAKQINHLQDFGLSIVGTAIASIRKIVSTHVSGRGQHIAFKITTDAASMSVAAQIMFDSYLSKRESSVDDIHCHPEAHITVWPAFRRNVLHMGLNGILENVSNPRGFLNQLAMLAPDLCSEIFSSINENDQLLDKFAVSMVPQGYIQGAGVVYSLNFDKELRLYCYCEKGDFLNYATRRLAAGNLNTYAKAAWSAVFDGKSYLGKNGSRAPSWIS